MGRPTKYKEEYNDTAYKYSLLGATDEELAKFFDVSAATIYEWKNVHPKFSEAIKNGKEDADANVTKSLYQRAMGYTHKEEKVFNNGGEIVTYVTEKHHPPDPTAMIFWLKNRQPDKWRDRKAHEHTGANGSDLFKAFANKKDSELLEGSGLDDPDDI